VPFRNTGIPELDGKTARQIQSEYGLAIAGALAPDDAMQMPGVGGLVGDRHSRRAEMADEEDILAVVESLQSGTSKEIYTSNYDRGYGADCCNVHRLIRGRQGDRTGWRFLTFRHGEDVSTQMTYVDIDPPRFTIDPRIRLEIHPDDVRYGFLIQGTLLDNDAPPETVRVMYDHLNVVDGQYVDVLFEYPDRAGNVLHQPYRVRVTASAARRGADLDHDLHAPTRLQRVHAFVARYAVPVLALLRRQLPSWL
jgi:hypothetical protein